MKLHELPSQTKSRKRVGRGDGSGLGKTAGRGTKGQKSRAGHHMMPRYFEGGQMPLTQRLPKLRGFRGPSADRWAVVTTKQLNKASGATVTLASLKESGTVSRSVRYLKVIGKDKVDKKLSVTADRISAGAEKSITDAGGTAKRTEKKEETAEADG